MVRSGQFEDEAAARSLPPESPSLEAVLHKIGISVATSENWHAAALASSNGNGDPRQWTPAARLGAVVATAAMDKAARRACYRGRTRYPTYLDLGKQDARAT